jgi:hypothetical protein
MNRAIDTLRKPRLHLLNLISELNTEQLNKIPDGFNNNIIWNLAHVVAAQQGICYKRTGVDIIVTEEFFEAYRPGTKPLKFVDAEEIESIKELLSSTLDRLEADLENGIFVNYTTTMTRYGVELTSIDDAIKFLPFHDGFHMGYVMALKRLVTH